MFSNADILKHLRMNNFCGIDYSGATNCPPGATGQFAYRPDCRQFLNCWKGRGLVQFCAPGTLFNPATLECDFPSKVKCLQLLPDEERLSGVETDDACME
jgi:hypothetical protein